MAKPQESEQRYDCRTFVMYSMSQVFTNASQLAIRYETSCCPPSIIGIASSPESQRDTNALRRPKDHVFDCKFASSI